MDKILDSDYSITGEDYIREKGEVGSGAALNEYNGAEAGKGDRPS